MAKVKPNLISHPVRVSFEKKYVGSHDIFLSHFLSFLWSVIFLKKGDLIKLDLSQVWLLYSSNLDDYSARWSLVQRVPANTISYFTKAHRALQIVTSWLVVGTPAIHSFLLKIERRLALHPYLRTSISNSPPGEWKANYQVPLTVSFYVEVLTLLHKYAVKCKKITRNKDTSTLKEVYYLKVSILVTIRTGVALKALRV